MFTQSTIDTENTNFETFSIVWLSPDVNSSDRKELQNRLRSIINYIRTFERAKECEEYIRVTPHDRITFIVTGQLGKELVPHITSLQQVAGIYIESRDSRSDEQWAVNYKKVSMVVTPYFLFAHTITNA